MSDSPSSTMGGLISALFRGKTNNDGEATGGGFTSKHKILSGALLAAGAAYLYKRSKAKQAAISNS